MKKNYYLIALVFSFTSLGIAQNTVTVDASATQNGYANVFETPINGGAYAFGGVWGVEDLKTVVDVDANTLTLQPNFNTYADNPADPFWVDQTTLEGNKTFEGNTYVEDASLVGSELTFEGNVTSNTIDATSVYFQINDGPLAGSYPALAALFGGAFTTTPITEDTAVVIDDNTGDSTDENDACDPITNGASLDGKIAIVRRGSCAFTIKVLAAQTEGAIAVIVVNNDGDPILMAGDEPAITIPALMVSEADGEAIITEVLGGGTLNVTMLLKAYVARAFIKVFNADFSVEKNVYAPLTGDSFSITFTDVGAEDATVQYGFQVTGINANPDDEVALGSVVVTDNTLGINDINDIKVSVYPNPTTNNINIQSDEQIMNITVYNTIGQMVRNVSPDTTNFSLEMANLDTGMYFVNVFTETGSKTVKVIKN